MPTLKIPPVLRRYAADRAEVRVAGTTVGAALEALFEQHPDLRPRVLDARRRLFPYLLLFRNDERLEREDPLAAWLGAGDVLEIVGAVEGG